MFSPVISWSSHRLVSPFARSSHICFSAIPTRILENMKPKGQTQSCSLLGDRWRRNKRLPVAGGGERGGGHDFVRDSIFPKPGAAILAQLCSLSLVSYAVHSLSCIKINNITRWQAIQTFAESRSRKKWPTVAAASVMLIACLVGGGNTRLKEMTLHMFDDVDVRSSS